MSYWDRNIERWTRGEDEELLCPRWFALLYRATVGAYERRLMVERRRLTVAFVDRYVRPGIIFADLGCGAGEFSVRALGLGARVHAIDSSAVALASTRAAVIIGCMPRDGIEYHLRDLSSWAPPPSDVALAMGLAPYVTDVATLLGNVLPTTRLLFVNYLDPTHWANRGRAAMPLLDVRRVRCHARDEVSRLYEAHGFRLTARLDFATGYIDTAERRRST